jgi:hypothetical protein
MVRLFYCNFVGTSPFAELFVFLLLSILPEVFRKTFHELFDEYFFLLCQTKKDIFRTRQGTFFWPGSWEILNMNWIWGAKPFQGFSWIRCNRLTLFRTEENLVRNICMNIQKFDLRFSSKMACKKVQNSCFLMYMLSNFHLENSGFLKEAWAVLSFYTGRFGASA